MNKTELIAAVAAESGLTKKDAEAAVNSVINVITNSLCAGERIQLVGFGTFDIKHRAARTGRNPATGATMQFPASVVPVFKVGKALKDEVSSKLKK